MEENVDESIPIPEDIHTFISPPPTSLEELRGKKVTTDDSVDSSNVMTSPISVEQPLGTGSSVRIGHYHDANEGSASAGSITPVESVSTSSTAPHTPLASDNAGSDSARFVANKLLGVAVTRDYSSPRSSGRSLSQASVKGAPSATTGLDRDLNIKKAPSMIGLGSNKAPAISAPPSTITDGTRSQSGGGLRPSSRASGASQLATIFNAQQQAAQSMYQTHKPSSRAQTISFPAPSDEEAAATAFDLHSSQQQLSQSQPHDVESDEPSAEELRNVARPLSNKLLSRVGATKEFPSPKLGPRSIGSAPSRSTPGITGAPSRSASVPQGRIGDRDTDTERLTPLSQQSLPVESVSPVDLSTDREQSLPLPTTQQHVSHIQPYDIQQPYPSQQPPPPSDAYVYDAYNPAAPPQEQAQQPSDVADNQQTVMSMMHHPDGTLNPDFDFSALALKKDPVAQLKAQVPIPVTASPKQFKSSLTLLDLAKKTSEPDDENYDTTGSVPIDHIATRPLNQAQIQRLQSSGLSLNGSKEGTGTGTTPKPAWLRRLDSPLTHHGKLMQAKSQLHQLMKRGISAASRLKPEAIPEAQRRLLAALDKIEQSTTIAAAQTSNLPQIPNM